MTAIDLDNDRMLKLSEVAHRTGFGVSTIYKKINTEGFPRPLKLGTRTSRWLQSEVADWLVERMPPTDAKSPN